MDHLKKHYCNRCGRLLEGETDSLLVHKEWNYFSGLDGKRYEFRVCEECFQEWIRSFCLPVKITERTEIL